MGDNHIITVDLDQILSNIYQIGLGQEDPLEKGMAIHSNTLAWRIPWTEEPGELSPWGRRVRNK